MSFKDLETERPRRAEITDVNRYYLEQGRLCHSALHGYWTAPARWNRWRRRSAGAAGDAAFFKLLTRIGRIDTDKKAVAARTHPFGRLIMSTMTPTLPLANDHDSGEFWFGGFTTFVSCILERGCAVSSSCLKRSNQNR